jgi:disulfide oxidoreductase YuzD
LEALKSLLVSSVLVLGGAAFTYVYLDQIHPPKVIHTTAMAETVRIEKVEVPVVVKETEVKVVEVEKETIIEKEPTVTYICPRRSR